MVTDTTSKLKAMLLFIALLLLAVEVVAKEKGTHFVLSHGNRVDAEETRGKRMKQGNLITTRCVDILEHVHNVVVDLYNEYPFGDLTKENTGRSGIAGLIT